MTLEINKGDANLEPDSSESGWFLSDEWRSDNGALISVTFDTTTWHSSFISDLKTRGPLMMDHIATRLSLNPQIISLFLCDDKHMREMNFVHRGFDKPTHVLSFPAPDNLQWAADQPTDEFTIGDIAIAGETVVREASEAGIVVVDHLLHLFTHGVLHLLGFNHNDDSTAAQMEGLEIDLLARMKIANPYRIDSVDMDNWGIG